MVLLDDELIGTADEATPHVTATAPRRRRGPRRLHAAAAGHRQGPPLDVDRPLRLDRRRLAHRCLARLPPRLRELAQPGPLRHDGWATSARRRPSTPPSRRPEATPSCRFLTMPRNGRGVYQVFVEVPVEGAPEPAEGEEPLHEHVTYFVDPGSGDDQRPRRRHRGGVVVAVPRAHVPVAGLGPVRRLRSRDRVVPRRRRRHRAGRDQGRRLRRAPRRHGHGRLARRCCSSSCCSPASTCGTGRACGAGRRRW